MKSCARVVLAGCLLLVFQGCATDYIKAPTALDNPPPKTKFSDFERFELKPIALAAEYQHHGENVRAKDRIQQELDNGVSTILASWNEKSKGKANPKTLVIEPEITQIKFINAGARVWTGALSGSSAVKMRVVYRNHKTAEIIAQPEFYQRAAAMGGAWTFGASDNTMLN